WYDDAGLLTPSGTYFKDYGNTGKTVQLYAKWQVETYNIIFDVNDGTVVIDTNYNFNTTLPSPTREGYTFEGWTLSEAYDNGVGESFKITPDLGNNLDTVNLYAKWIIETYKFELIFNDASTLNEYHQVIFNEMVGELPTPTLPNYFFNGWFFDVALSQEVTSETIVVDFGENGQNVKIYAKWTRDQETMQPSVTIIYKNGNTTLLTDEVLYGLPYGELYNPYPGYSVNWYLDSQFTIEITSNTIVTDTELHTLYGNWKPIIYSITYVIDEGGNNENNPIHYTIEENNIVLQNPTKDGYAFLGWYLNDNYTNKITNISSGSYGDVVLYAHFEYGSNGITYQYVSGTNSYRITGYDKIDNSLIIPSYANDGSHGRLLVTEIYQYAFQNSNIVSAIIPSGITSIGNYAFSGNPMVSITLPFTGASSTYIEGSQKPQNHLGYIFGYWESSGMTSVPSYSSYNYWYYVTGSGSSTRYYTVNFNIPSTLREVKLTTTTTLPQ
ncbi:InlB B-repeat-containing protein, partial [Acholeplasma laidlawii]|uniref:InlB B-repeat-containing protein n=1 Tax=Acholeplasma laidlawii TaxID=2148 RepID=UPI0018C2E536